METHKDIKFPLDRSHLIEAAVAEADTCISVGGLYAAIKKDEEKQIIADTVDAIVDTVNELAEYWTQQAYENAGRDEYVTKCLDRCTVLYNLADLIKAEYYKP